MPAAEHARLAVKVARCKMQYKGTMEQPFFTLSIRGRGGSEVEPPQDTPPAYYANGVVSADHAMVVTTPIAQIPQGDCAIPCCPLISTSFCFCLFACAVASILVPGSSPSQSFRARKNFICIHILIAAPAARRACCCPGAVYIHHIQDNMLVCARCCGAWPWPAELLCNSGML